MSNNSLSMIAIFVATAAMSGCVAETHPHISEPKPAVTVTVSDVQLTNYDAGNAVSGTVRAVRRAVVMVRISGVVSQMAVSPGQTVSAGELLAEIDAKEITAKRDQAKALALHAAEDLRRAKRLTEKDAVASADYDAVLARSTAATAVAAEMEVMVGYTHITAPFAGTIIRKQIEVGELVTPGHPIIDLEDSTSLRLEVDVPESLAARLEVGSHLRADVQVADFDQEVTVVEVTPSADPVSRTVLIKMALPMGIKRLQSGQFGRVKIPGKQQPTILVATSALRSWGQLDAVFVVNQGFAHRRLVRIGPTAGDRTIIRAGLAVGDRVVADGHAILSDGQAVIVH